jgi:hypothetical protein
MSLISKNLRGLLRQGDYQKVATLVMAHDQEYVADFSDLGNVIKSISVKVATNRHNEAQIEEGILAYKHLRGL